MAVEPIRRQSITSFVWKIALTFIGFMSTMYFAHTVGADILGAYFLFTAYFGVINLFSNGGLGGAAVKRISEGKEQNAYFTAFIVLRSIFITTVIVALLTFQNFFVDLNEAGVFNWLLVALIISMLYGAVNNAIVGCGKVGIQATCGFINDSTRIFVQVLTVFFGYGVFGLVGGFVAGMIVAFVIELYFFDLHLARFRWDHVKSLSTFSFWLFLTSSGVMVYSYADTVMIGYYMNNSDVGIYRVVMQFTSIATLVTTSLQTTLWPRISHWGKNGNIKPVESSLSRAITYALLLAIPICIGGILVGDKLLYYFYGAEFSQGYFVLVVMLIVQIINIFQLFFLTYLSALDMQKNAFKVTFIAATVNIVLNAVLVPVIGIEGAAVSTFISMGLNAFLAWKCLSRIITTKIEYNSVSNIIKASFAMALFVGGYRILVPMLNIWITLIPVVFGGLVYGALILKLDGEINRDISGIIEKSIHL
jgi:O-antigen/teichoic acid export membrane protein